MKLNKFYGVSKLNSRSQIGIPKQAREDFHISSGDNLALLMGILPHSKDALMLMKAEQWFSLSEDAPIKNNANHEFSGLVKMAERGQIVIPKKVRTQLGITLGTQILILSHEKTQGIILAILNQDAIGKWAANLIKSPD
ncbi:MAG: AbrB/MazE/SpoVT family DNA-binding domain-containing protein [Promethearchaeota archaeon]